MSYISYLGILKCKEPVMQPAIIFFAPIELVSHLSSVKEKLNGFINLVRF